MRMIFSRAQPLAGRKVEMHSDKNSARVESSDDAQIPAANTDRFREFEAVLENTVKAKLDESFQNRAVKYEMKYTYPDLGERSIFISYFPISGPGGVERVVCLLQDITERKRVHELIRQERDRAQSYLDIADVILLALDL